MFNPNYLLSIVQWIYLHHKILAYISGIVADSSQSVDQILVGNVPVVAAVKCHEGLQVGCSFLHLVNVNYANMFVCCAEHMDCLYLSSKVLSECPLVDVF